MEGRRLADVSALDGDMRLTDWCLVATELSLYLLPKIFQYVEAISDLPRLWGTLAWRIGVEAGAIAVDDLKFRLLPEPGRRGRRGAIREQSDHLALFEIDNDGSIVEAFAPSPLIDTSDADRGMFRLGQGGFLEAPENRGVAHRHSQAGHQPFRRSTSCRMTEEPHNSGQASGPTSEARCPMWKLLREDPTTTCCIAASPSGCSGSDRHWRSVGREILDCS